EIYHIGASLKDLGKKWFAFTKLHLDPGLILERL
ncbi:MAG: DNA-binding protein, partial [Candidatus Neomarinimicrobiota bacterium]